MSDFSVEERRSGEVVDRAIAVSGDRVGNPRACSHPERAGAAATGGGRIGPFVQTALKIVVAIVREIFDESAYERFLGRTKGARSVRSYQAFLEEKESSLARKPRCC
jgi:hypothetical protein